MKSENQSGLYISNLSKTYPNGIKALDQISLKIPYGMFGLLGPNGAGKSTLMRILATLQNPDSGTIGLDNYDLIHEKDAIRSTLGYLPQDFGLPKHINAEKLLTHFAILKGITHDRKNVVHSLLHKTNLWEKRNVSVSGFSGGMKQRFGVAVALLGNPKLLIVDEPTAGLDPDERVRFLNLLSELGEKSIVILSSHIVEDIAELCTSLAIIKKGRILLETTPQDSISALKGLVWANTVDKLEAEELENKVKIISKKLVGGKTLIHAYEHEKPGIGFCQVEPNLEDVYFCAMANYHFDKKSNQAL